MADSISNESLLIEKIRKGNDYAFEIAFLKYYKKICRYVWKYVRSEALAKEIAQDVFADIWENRDRLDPEKNLEGLLYTSARYKSLDYIKHKKVVENYRSYKKLEKKDHLYTNMHYEESAHESLLEDFEEVINDLPSKARTVFLLSRRDGLTYKEIAHHLSISVKTVESQISRVLRILRSRLSHYLPLFLLSCLNKILFF